MHERKLSGANCDDELDANRHAPTTNHIHGQRARTAGREGPPPPHTRPNKTATALLPAAYLPHTLTQTFNLLPALAPDACNWLGRFVGWRGRERVH